MAKLEIPSIVVQSGTHSPPKMDRATRSRQWSMSQQSTCDEDCEPVVGVVDTQEQATQSPDPATPDTPETPATHTTSSPAQTNNILTRSRSKNSLKLLKRSQAVNESTSPPPDLPPSPVNIALPPPTSAPITLSNNNNNNNNNTVNNNKRNETLGPNTRPTIKREGSIQSCDSNRSGHLSRGNSSDQSTEVSVEKWIVDKINSSKKDRNFMLKLESDFLNLIKDQKKSCLKYDPLPAYQRMIVHKCSEYWGLEHNTIKESMMVISKPKNYSPTDKNISDLIDRELNLSDEEPRRSILKRDSASFEESVTFKSPERHGVEAPRRSKSFEEREEEYEKVRRRIFQAEHMNGNGNYTEKGRPQWPQVANPWFTDSSKLHPGNIPMARMLRKNESYESNELLKANSLRQTTTINKAHSFGGYEDPATTNNRVLTKQDSGSSVSSRVSPSSSGYKSVRSDATISATPSPTATPHLTTQLSSQSEVSPDPEGEAVVWAVTSMNSVPTGSVLINPQTGLPLVNADGSVYHFDPANPPNLQMDPDNRLARRTPSDSREEEESLARSHNHHHQNNASPPIFTESNPGEVMHPSILPASAVHHNVATPSTTTPASTHSVAPAPAHIMPYPHMTPVHPLSYPSSATSLMYSPSPPYTMGMAGNEQITKMPPVMYGLPTSQYSSLPISQTPVSYDRTPLPIETQPYDGHLRMMMGLNLGADGRARPSYITSGHQPPSPFGPTYSQGRPYYLTPVLPPTPAIPGHPGIRYTRDPFSANPERPSVSGEWIHPTPSLGQPGEWIHPTPSLGQTGEWIDPTKILGQAGDWIDPTKMLGQPLYRGQGNAAPFGHTTNYGVGVLPFQPPMNVQRSSYRMSAPAVPAPPTITSGYTHNNYPLWNHSSGLMMPQTYPPHSQAMQMMPQMVRSPNQLGVTQQTQGSVGDTHPSSVIYMRSSPGQPPVPLVLPSSRPIIGGNNQMSQARGMLGGTPSPLTARAVPAPNNNRRLRAPPRPVDTGMPLHQCTSCVGRNSNQSCPRNRRHDFDANPSGKYQVRRY